MRSLDLAPFERIFDLGGTTDVWLGRSLGTTSRDRLLAQSPQLTRFGPVARGVVWTDDKGRLPSGATPIGVEALGRPDLVLADMIAILHPELMPGHTLRYYEPLQ
jgi:iron complex transport system substrate-binding protein